MKIILQIIYLVTALFIFIDIGFCQHRIYVNPLLGNDGNSGRDIAYPLRTLNQAGSICRSGDTIFIRGGQFSNEAFTFIRTDIDSSGYVWIMPYFNESVILDGAGYNFPSWQAVLNIDHSRNVIIQNLHVMNNNNGSGIRVVSDSFPLYITRNVIIRKCTVNHTYRQGILVQANNVTIDSCEIYDAVFSHANEQGTTWDFTLGTYLWPSNINCWSNIVFKNNKIHNSWGEGIVALRCYNFTIENNHVYDCYSCYIYVDNSRKGIIRNNWVNSIDSTYYRHYDSSGFYAPAVGIQWAAEGNSYKVDSLISDLDIYNNLITGANTAISWWRDPRNNYFNNSYKNINVYNNTIFNTLGYESFHLDINTTNIFTPSNCNFKDNIICMGKYHNIYRQYFTTSSHYPLWQIDYNCFINGNIPISIQHNITGAPTFVDSLHINLDTNLRIKSTSNCNHSAIPISGITRDYWNAKRDSLHPSIGFHEYGGLMNTNSGIMETPNEFSLLQNYPNPFNPSTTINFELAKSGYVRLIIYDITGRIVRLLLDNKFVTAGMYKIAIDVHDLSSGIYFYKLTTGSNSLTKKMVLIK